MSRTGIRVAGLDEDRLRCFPVMAQLRPGLTEQAFMERTRRQSADGGYELVMLEVDGQVRAVAGFRETENLASGRHIYVDDLVTDDSDRSQGLGAELFDWLVSRAREAGCDTLELDSGVQRARAHGFYFRHAMHIVSFRFRLSL